jgi:NAD(P)-dependent dehydrogenase (short-subunit alcohol dehydrogenase family)
MTFSANTVLITGASRGIGAATAVAAARNGFDVAVNYIQDEAAAQSVVDEVVQYGRKAIAIQADVSKPDDVRRMFRMAEEALGPLAGLVNNAGLTGRIGSFIEATPATIERVFAVNVFGAMQCARTALESFNRRQQTGIIVNVSSVAAHTGSPHEYVHYAASKAAIEAFTLGLAREVASHGIRVCAVAPGSTLTDIHATAGEPNRPERIAGLIPMGRLAYPSEIAETIVWLLSPAASYVTGRVLHCSGGL